MVPGTSLGAQIAVLKRGVSLHVHNRSVHAGNEPSVNVCKSKRGGGGGAMTSMVQG